MSLVAVEPRKHDTGKLRLELAIGPGWLETAKALTYGATKYAAFNYRHGSGLEYSRLIGAALRHLTAFANGEDKDPESGISHLGHAGASVQMLADLVELGRGIDDRWRP